MPDLGDAGAGSADDDRSTRRRGRVWIVLAVIVQVYLLIRGGWALMTWAGAGANPYVVIALVWVGVLVVAGVTTAAVRAGRKRGRRAASRRAG